MHVVIKSDKSLLLSQTSTYHNNLFETLATDATDGQNIRNNLSWFVTVVLLQETWTAPWWNTPAVLATRKVYGDCCQVEPPNSSDWVVHQGVMQVRDAGRC